VQYGADAYVRPDSEWVQLHLDRDGELTDFYWALTALPGMLPRIEEKHQEVPEFWKRIINRPNSHGFLHLMPKTALGRAAVRRLKSIILSILRDEKGLSPSRDAHAMSQVNAQCFASDGKPSKRRRIFWF
jgi:hypothetical protein